VASISPTKLIDVDRFEAVLQAAFLGRKGGYAA